MDKKIIQKSMLLIAAVGIVFGDIGTSPLYALKTCFTLTNIALSKENIYGVTGLIFWALFLIVNIKYIKFVFKFTSYGEGGIFVLSKLAEQSLPKKLKKIGLILGIIGSGFFFGDGIITPAISILSAYEGLSLLSPNLNSFITGFEIFTLIALFYFQYRGSSKLGFMFGPIMIIWFATLALLGLFQIFHHPSILLAILPYYPIKFLFSLGYKSFLCFGGIILVISGAEALYADLAHFGKGVIIKAWTKIVFPSLILNYLGQGALLIEHPEFLDSPFYHLAPVDYLPYLIVLSVWATIIASQSVISGIFSLVWQGMMLNYLPRMKVIHTSDIQVGQVYVPAINMIMGLLTLLAVLIFKNSENLAQAYGLNVASVMVITSLLMMAISTSSIQTTLKSRLVPFIIFFMIDLIFLGANLHKFQSNGLFSFTLAFCFWSMIRTWIKGSKILRQKAQNELGLAMSLEDYLKENHVPNHQRIPKTAIFMSREPHKVPSSLPVHLKHYKFLFKKMIFVSIITKNIPKNFEINKFSCIPIDDHAYTIIAEYGFKEVPDLSAIIRWMNLHNILSLDEDYSFILSHGVAVPSESAELKNIEESIYIYLLKNSAAAYEFFRLPNDKVIEIGIRYNV